LSHPSARQHLCRMARFARIRTGIESLRERLAPCLERQTLRRTLTIALVVGTVLTAINQLGVLTSGTVTLATCLRCGANYLVPFIVSNLGVLSGQARG